MAEAPAAPPFLNIKAVVVESGDSHMGKRVLEKRNLVEDFRVLFGTAPEQVIGLRIQINSQHTQSDAEAFWKTIRFTSR